MRSILQYVPGLTLLPALLWGSLMLSRGEARGQCPPDLVPYTPGEAYGVAPPYQSCYSSRLQSPVPRGLLGGRLRQAIRSREVYRSGVATTTRGRSPRVIYSSPIIRSVPSTETYSSSWDMTTSQTYSSAYSSLPSAGGVVVGGGYPRSTFCPGCGATNYSSCPRPFP